MCEMSLFRMEPGLMPPHVEALIRQIATEEHMSEYRLLVAPGSFKGDNYLGQINQVRIVSDAPKQREIALVVKISPTGEHIRDSVPINQFYAREIQAYSQVLPAFAELRTKRKVNDVFRFAKFYKGTTEENRETIILEDLCYAGFGSYDKTKPLDVAHLETVIVALAQFHAASFVMEKENPKLFERLVKNASRELEYHDVLGKVMECTKKGFLKSFEDEENRIMIAIYLEDMLEKFKHFVDPATTTPYNVLCHGDCWTNNFMFSYENDKVTDVRFLDWQITRLASPVTDITYMMYSSTDEKTRSECFDRMLNLYYKTLRVQFQDMGHDPEELYPESIYWKHVEIIKPFGLITSSMVLPMGDDDDDGQQENEEDEIRFVKAFSELCKDHTRGAAKNIVLN